MNKVFRDNLEFLFDRFESQDLCAVVVSIVLVVHIISGNTPIMLSYQLKIKLVGCRV
jgi:hypothetical protein